MDVDVTDISAKVCAHYPGRSAALPKWATAIARWRDGVVEVSRGRSRVNDQTPRAKPKLRSHDFEHTSDRRHRSHDCEVRGSYGK